MIRKILFFLSCLILVLFAVCSTWLGSGSIAPYATTYSRVEVGECGYLYNIDQPQFVYAFQMLDGVPKSNWEMGVLLRRVLYPILAYPSMKVWGLNLGGFITNIWLVIFATSALIIFLYRRFGPRAALVGGLLYAFYPGLTYYGGLPYCYFFIAQASILAFITIHWLDANPSFIRATITGAFLGILATGYDLLPFFAPVTILTLIFRRRFLLWIPTVAIMALPQFGVIWYQTNIMGLNPNTSNSEVYRYILKAILNPNKELYDQWLSLIYQAPYILMHNFLSSTFWALPIAFCMTYLAARKTVSARLTTPEWALIVAGLVLWSVNNFAPPYSGWQMRGTWLARLYQPVFIAYLFYIARIASILPRTSRAAKNVLLIVGCCTAFQAFVVISPILGIYNVAGRVYREFYQHADYGFFEAHMEHYGARPRGFCKR